MTTELDRHHIDVGLDIALSQGAGVAEVLKVISVVHGRGAELLTISCDLSRRPPTLQLEARVQRHRPDLLKRTLERCVFVEGVSATLPHA